MKLRRLGRTNLHISEVSINSQKTLNVDLIDLDFFNKTRSLIDMALSEGINFFNTFSEYENIQIIFGKLLYDHLRNNKVVVSTNIWAHNLKEAEMQINKSFRNLQVEKIHLVQVHTRSPWKELLAILKSLKREEKIEAIGIVEHRPMNLKEVVKAINTDEFDTVQVSYNYLNRKAEEELFPLCKKMDIGIIATSPISTFNDKTRLLEAFDRVEPKQLMFLEKYNIKTPAQILMKFVLENSLISTALFTTTKIDHLKEVTTVSETDHLSEYDLYTLREELKYLIN